jgi:hypothetical protein
VDVRDGEQVLDPSESDVLAVMRGRIQLEQRLGAFGRREMGIAILIFELTKEISFINSGISHPRTGKTAVAPEPLAQTRGDRGEPSDLQQLWCRATNVCTQAPR